MADDEASKPIFEKIDSTLQFGWTEFLIHVRDGNVAKVQEMISGGYALNDLNSYGQSTLTISVISKNERMVKTILDARSFSYDALATELIDPVSLACLLGLQEIVLILLEELPHLINRVNTSNGYTPIFFAAIKKQYRIVELLIAKGADLSVRNSAGHTLFEMAMIMNDAELVAFLSAKSTADERQKPRCHPRLYTPPRCFEHDGVSPPSPSKPRLKPAKRKIPSTLPTPKTRQMKSNLSDMSFIARENSFEPSSESDGEVSFSDSFFSHDFTPLAKSSLAFRNTTSSNNLSLPFNNSSICASPSLLGSYRKIYSPSPNSTFHHRSVSDVNITVTAPAAPFTDLKNGSYHHFTSPDIPSPQNNSSFLRSPLVASTNFHNFQAPRSPLLTPKFSETLMTPQLLLTPKTCDHLPKIPPYQLSPGNSFVDAYVTPLRVGPKKVSLRTKLLDKLYKREKLFKNDENQNPESVCANDLESVLEYLGLQKYHKLFEVHQVEPYILSTFTDSDLQSMGFHDSKTRKIILKKIRKGLLIANA